MLKKLTTFVLALSIGSLAGSSFAQAQEDKKASDDKMMAKEEKMHDGQMTDKSSKKKKKKAHEGRQNGERR